MKQPRPVTYKTERQWQKAKKRRNNIIASLRKRGAHEHGSWLSVLAHLEYLLLSNSFVCLYCQLPFSFVKLSIDHLWPISRGGDNSMCNLGDSCLPCNQAKADLNKNEFEAILACIRPMDTVARRSVLSRLRFGGRMFWKVKK